MHYVAKNNFIYRICIVPESYKEDGRWYSRQVESPVGIPVARIIKPEFLDFIALATDALEALKDLRDAVHSGGFPHESVNRANILLQKAGLK